jgi:hypothetical protein
MNFTGAYKAPFFRVSVPILPPHISTSPSARHRTRMDPIPEV